MTPAAAVLVLIRSGLAEPFFHYDGDLLDIPRFLKIKDGWEWDNLSSGERVLVEVGHALWNGGGNATVNDLAKLDHITRATVFAAIGWAWER